MHLCNQQTDDITLPAREQRSLSPKPTKSHAELPNKRLYITVEDGGILITICLSSLDYEYMAPAEGTKRAEQGLPQKLRARGENTRNSQTEDWMGLNGFDKEINSGMVRGLSLARFCIQLTCMAI